MKLVRLSSWGMCAVVLAFFVTASKCPRPSEFLAKPFDARPNASTQPVTSEEWRKVGDWMKANNCARRYEFVDHLPDSPFKEHAEQLMADRIRMIERVKYADLRNALVNQVQAQDQIFALQIEYRRNRRGEKPVVEMKKAVERLIDAEVAERNARADHLHADAVQLLQKKNDPVFIARQAQSYFNSADRPRALRSPGELGTGSDGDSADADVAR